MKSIVFGVGLIVAHACSGGVVHAQKERPMSRPEAFWKNQIPPPDSTELRSIEAALIKLSTDSRGVDCHSLRDALISLAASLGGGKPSKLYPDIFNLALTRCTDWDAYSYLLMGNVFFSNQDFEKAVTLYRQASEMLKPDQEEHLNAALNIGACLVSLGNYTEAISTFQSVIDHAYERADVYQPMATINLSAAQLNAGFDRDAAETLRQLPTENLSEYWRSLLFSNALIAHQNLADYTGSDSVWKNHLSLVPFKSLPPDIHPHILSELLHQGDFIEFTKFKNAIIASQQSPLLDPNHSHFLLFKQEESDEQSNVVWDLYRDFEERQRKANQTLQEKQPTLQSQFQLIEQELSQERQATRNWKLTTAFIVLAILTAITVILFLRTRRLRNHLSSISHLKKTAHYKKPQVDEEDLVVLAQALTYGKGLQKALLIVRRLQADFADQSQSRLNLETIEFYQELNEREKEVAGFIASGFNSKEIAQMLNVTTQYIYNVRSRIREKFAVPEEQDLLQWFREVGNMQQTTSEESKSPRL